MTTFNPEELAEMRELLLIAEDKKKFSKIQPPPSASGAVRSIFHDRDRHRIDSDEDFSVEPSVDAMHEAGHKESDFH